MTTKNHKTDYYTSRGFTLVELLITISILAIAMAIAVPNITAWRANARFNAAARAVVSNFQLAKMEAAKRNVICTITFNLPTYDYVVYVDADQDLEFDAGEQLLKFVNFSDYGGTNLVVAAFADNDNVRPSVAFNSRGLPINNAGAPGGGSVTLDNNYGRTKTITVTAAGCVSIP